VTRQVDTEVVLLVPAQTGTAEPGQSNIAGKAPSRRRSAHMIYTVRDRIVHRGAKLLRADGTNIQVALQAPVLLTAESSLLQTQYRLEG
jgi:hypothetical protein